MQATPHSQIPLVHLCLITGREQIPIVGTEACRFARPIHLQRIQQLLGFLREDVRLARLFARETEVGAVGAAASHEVCEILLVERAHREPLQLLLGHIIAVEVLPVAG